MPNSDASSVLDLLADIIRCSTEKTTCSLAFWCLSKQRFESETISSKVRVLQLNGILFITSSYHRYFLPSICMLCVTIYLYRISCAMQFYITVLYCVSSCYKQFVVSGVFWNMCFYFYNGLVVWYAFLI